jgi:hypothetical protein
MELNVLASVLPAKAWWDEDVPEQKNAMPVSRDFEPVKKQLVLAANMLTKLYDRSDSGGVADQDILAALDAVKRAIDAVDKTMRSFI